MKTKKVLTARCRCSKKGFLLLALAFVLNCTAVSAQESRVGTLPLKDGERLHQIGLLVGHYGLLDEYLSPNVYTGVMLGIEEHRSRPLWHQDDWLFNLTFKADVALTSGPNGKGSMNGIMFDGRVAFQKIWLNTPSFSLTAGPEFYLKLGGVENARNSNNVAQLKLHLAAAASGEAIWRFRIGNYPLALSWEFDLPLIGYGFAPTYGLQYYEIAYMNKISEASHCVWPGNMFAMTQYASVIIPVRHIQLKFSYAGDYHSSDIGNIRCRINENAFMVSMVKRFEKIHNGR